jgi:hypothetical protein
MLCTRVVDPVDFAIHALGTGAPPMLDYSDARAFAAGLHVANIWRELQRKYAIIRDAGYAPTR